MVHVCVKSSESQQVGPTLHYCTPLGSSLTQPSIAAALGAPGGQLCPEWGTQLTLHDTLCRLAPAPSTGTTHAFAQLPKHPSDWLENCGCAEGPSRGHLMPSPHHPLKPNQHTAFMYFTEAITLVLGCVLQKQLWNEDPQTCLLWSKLCPLQFLW